MQWVAVPFSRGSSQPRDQTQVSALWILYQLSHKGNPRILEWVAYPFYSDLPNPGVEQGSPDLQVDSLPTELSRKPYMISLICEIKKKMNLYTKWKRTHRKQTYGYQRGKGGGRRDKLGI